MRLRGWHPDGGLKVEVTAPPEGGKANEAVVRLLAGSLGVPRASITVKRGAGSRNKVIEVAEMSEAELKSRIERALDADGDARGE